MIYELSDQNYKKENCIGWIKKVITTDEYYKLECLTLSMKYQEF
jgi:hypothetical protein